MVEFISDAAEKAESEEPPPDEDEASQQESLEELVEAESEEFHETHEDRDYIDDSSEPAEYTHANDVSIDLRESKSHLKPLVYIENGTPVVVDIFELYGKNQPEDDKSFLKRSL